MPVGITTYQVDLSGVIRPRRLYQFIGGVRPPRSDRRISPFRQSPYTEEIALHGAGMLRGTITEQGSPSRSRIAALESYSLAQKWATVSDKETGRWTVYPLPNHLRYIVIGADRRLRFNAECADGLRPVPWEPDE